MTGSLTSLLEGEAQGRFLRRHLGLVRIVTTNLDHRQAQVFDMSSNCCYNRVSWEFLNLCRPNQHSARRVGAGGARQGMNDALNIPSHSLS